MIRGARGQIAALLVARALTQLGILLSGGLVARHLGSSAFGLYTFYAAVGTILIAGATGGIPVFLLRETASGRSADSEVLPLLALFLVLALGGSVGASVAVLLAAPVGSTLTLTVLMLAAFTLLALPPFFSALRTGRNQFGRAAMGEALAGPVAFGLTWLALHEGEGLAGAMLALAGGGLAGTLVMMRGIALPRSPWSLRALARSTGPFIALGLANSGYVRVDAIAVSAFGSPGSLALYAAAYRLLGPISLLTSAFGTVFFARLAPETPGGERWHALRRRGTLALVSAVTALTVLSVAVTPAVIRALYGSSFEGAITPARILLLSSIPLAFYWPLAHGLNATSGERSWLSILVVGLLVDVVLVSVLVGTGGATAAAVSWCVTEVLILLLSALVLRRHLRRISASNRKTNTCV
ncbi:MAG: hypothetical protein NVSMB55_08860 [Mycobacteriales bacterium]